MDNAELKKVSLQFRRIASDLIASHHQQARHNLRRFLKIVEETPVLSQAIEEAPTPNDDPLGQLKKATEEARFIELPLDDGPALGFLDSLLRTLVEADGEFWRYCYGYGGSHGMPQCVEVFLGHIGKRYYELLNAHLEESLIEESIDASGETGPHVQVSGGNPQINIAQGTGRIVATQVIQNELAEVADLTSRILEEIPRYQGKDFSKDDLEKLKDVVEVLHQEVEGSPPRKNLLRVTRDSLISLAAVPGASDVLSGLLVRLMEVLDTLPLG